MSLLCCKLLFKSTKSHKTTMIFDGTLRFVWPWSGCSEFHKCSLLSENSCETIKHLKCVWCWIRCFLLHWNPVFYYMCICWISSRELGSAGGLPGVRRGSRRVCGSRAGRSGSVSSSWPPLFRPHGLINMRRPAAASVPRQTLLLSPV